VCLTRFPYTPLFRSDMAGARWVYGQARNSGPGAARAPRSLDEPSYTIRANGSGSHPSGTEWVYVNGNQANAARRPADRPAPTVRSEEHTSELQSREN